LISKIVTVVYTNTDHDLCVSIFKLFLRISFLHFDLHQYTVRIEILDNAADKLYVLIFMQLCASWSNVSDMNVSTNNLTLVHAEAWCTGEHDSFVIAPDELFIRNPETETGVYWTGSFRFASNTDVTGIYPYNSTA